MPRIEPMSAGWEARTLPLCYANPPLLLQLLLLGDLLLQPFLSAPPWTVASANLLISLTTYSFSAYRRIFFFNTSSLMFWIDLLNDKHKKSALVHLVRGRCHSTSEALCWAGESRTQERSSGNTDRDKLPASLTWLDIPYTNLANCN